MLFRSVNPVYAALSQTRSSILQSLQDQGVMVDSEALTDVHLLKRHVLKRCTYGVDLNPMAVELAKVSLWLDAFTLGAPLSFLDHHLRCGNSLIGSTFADLRQATESQLFGFNYEPMYRAISNVLLVARLADATAAEVHESADRYAQARLELSGYRVVLDLLTARHFGQPQAVSLLQQGNTLNLQSETALLGSLHARDRKIIAAVETLARSREFFHWELEFPECFFQVRPGTERQIEEKPAGQSGFDAVVGNPPYVRQEAITENKDWFKAAFDAVYAATCDLYVYFMQREIELLKTNGRMSMIVANKWLRAGYGRKLRGYLLRVARPESIVDFGHSPIFPDADTFPCIPILSRRPESLGDTVPEGELFHATQFPREDYSPQMDIAPYVSARRQKVATYFLGETGWSLEDPRVQRLLQKLATYTPLESYAAGAIFRGVGTGKNEAFFIDENTRSALIASHSKSQEIILPLLRGRDIDRWSVRSSRLFLIATRRGIDIRHYPAIYKHLLQFRQQLEPKPSDWDESRQGGWPGRAAGDYHWYELQASPSDEAMAAFSKQKVVFQEMAWFNRFAFDISGAALNNTAYVIPDARPSIRAILNSPLAWWYMTRTAQHGKDEVLRLIGTYMDQFPMPEHLTDDDEERFALPVEQLTDLQRKRMNWEQEFSSDVRTAVDHSEDDDRMLDWLTRGSEDFLRMVASMASQSLTPGVCEKLEKLRSQGVRYLRAMLAEQLMLEKQIAALVEDAYGLSAEERQLLRETRPVRDPIDVMETRLACLRG